MEAFAANPEENFAGIVVEEDADGTGAQDALCPVLRFGDDVRVVLNLHKPTYFTVRLCTPSSDDKKEENTTAQAIETFVQRLQMFLDYGPDAETRDVRAVLRHASHLYLHEVRNAPARAARLAAARPRLAADLAALARRPVFARAPRDTPDAAAGAVHALLVASAAGALLDGFCRAPGADEVADALLMAGGAAAGTWLAPGECPAPAKAACACLSALARLSSHGSAGNDVGDGDDDWATRLQRACPAPRGVGGVRAALLEAAVLGVWGHRLPVEQLAVLVADRCSDLSIKDKGDDDGEGNKQGTEGEEQGEEQKQEQKEERLRDVSAACACVACAVAYLVGNPGDAERHAHAHATACYVAESVVPADGAAAACRAAAQLAHDADIARSARQAAIPLLVFAPECAALCLALTHVLRRTLLVPALESTAAAGGGRAQSLRFALVGALAGALHGAWCVPAALWDQLVTCPLYAYGTTRAQVPEDALPAAVDAALPAVLESAPSSLSA